MDGGKGSFQWSLYSTSTGIGTAATGSAGAAIADITGFTATFLLAGLLCMLGCLMLFILESKRVESIGTQYSKGKRRRPAFASMVALLKL